MTKFVTVAMAEKMIESFEEDKNYYLSVERSCSTYVAAKGEEPVIPDYTYVKTADMIEECDLKIMHLKHALQVHNITAEIKVFDDIMSVDMIECRIAQLTKRKSILGKMRMANAISRVSNKNGLPEYVYINYDMYEVCEDYDMISEEIIQLQSALELFKQTVQFEVEFEV